MKRNWTRRHLLRVGGQLLTAATLTSCRDVRGQTLTPGSAYLATQAVVSNSSKPPLAGVLQASLPIPVVPLSVKIGQMIMLGFRGRYLAGESAIMQELQESHVGNVVLFRHNIQSPAQLSELTATLQADAPIPLLIAVDHEGGRVNRFVGDFGLTSNYSAQVLGEQDDLLRTRSQNENVAERLHTFGINLNLAPVVDLNLNPTNPVIGGVERSFSADPAVVTAHAKAVIESHHTHHVLCTLKHFPGHGSSQQDSHLGFVDVTESWQVSELLPYAELINSGLCDAVMTAHIFNAALDVEHPATLSKAIIDDILRKRLGYDGVVISDDMQMRAISAKYDFEDAVRLVITAGVDMIAISNMFDYAADWGTRTASVIQRLVASGAISPQRIDQSYRRIMRLKQRLTV
jgi:beta-N-acetylhexosaminidase